MKFSVEQESGYARTIEAENGSINLCLRVTESEALDLMEQIARGFSNLVTSPQWDEILDAITA